MQNHNIFLFYRDEIAAWRKALKLGDNHNILVAFAWCSDEDLRMAGIFQNTWPVTPHLALQKDR